LNKILSLLAFLLFHQLSFAQHDLYVGGELMGGLLGGTALNNNLLDQKNYSPKLGGQLNISFRMFDFIALEAGVGQHWSRVRLGDDDFSTETDDFSINLRNTQMYWNYYGAIATYFRIKKTDSYLYGKFAVSHNIYGAGLDEVVALANTIPVIGFGFTERELYLAKDIAHELAHFIFNVEKPIVDFAWGMLEEQYRSPNLNTRYDPTSTTEPSYPGVGHLEGSSTGNSTAYAEYEMGKQLIENYIWEHGIAAINNHFENETSYYDSQGVMDAAIKQRWKDDIKDFKEKFTPFYAKFNGTNFEVRNYLKGNLHASEIELPKI
jgi:hypothetical protein